MFVPICNHGGNSFNVGSLARKKSKFTKMAFSLSIRAWRLILSIQGWCENPRKAQFDHKSLIWTEKDLKWRPKHPFHIPNVCFNQVHTLMSELGYVDIPNQQGWFPNPLNPSLNPNPYSVACTLNLIPINSRHKVNTKSFWFQKWGTRLCITLYHEPST